MNARCRVLVVDDDKLVRESLLDELSISYDVDAANCGGDAIPLLQRNRYDAVVSDFHMPDRDGLWVLDNVRELQPHAARILLTGHLDERARRATAEADAPYKVGKPWHDTLEVTLRRAIEAESRKREFDNSFDALLDLARHDEDLAAVESPQEVAELLLHKAQAFPGVTSMETRTRTATGLEQTCALPEDPDEVDVSGERWRLDVTLTGATEICVRAMGRGRPARQMLQLLLDRTQHWLAENPLSRLARRAAIEPVARDRLMSVARRATIGATASSLMHELSSIVQAMQFSMAEIVARANDVCPGDDLVHDLSAVTTSSHRIVSLFSAMRRFVHGGDAEHMRLPVDLILNDAVTLCHHMLPPGCEPRLPQCGAHVMGSRTLLTQVFVNLVRNAAEVTPPGGTIDLEVGHEGDDLRISVTDDGPGVADELVDHLFEPFATDKGPDGGTGLGLAFAADVVRAHHGLVEYAKAPGRGARFTVILPRST